MGRSIKFLMVLAMATLMAVLSDCGVAAAGNGVQDNADVSNTQASVAAMNQAGNGVRVSTGANTETNTEAKMEGNSFSGGRAVIEHWHCNVEIRGGLVVDELVKQFNESNDHIQVVAKHNPDIYRRLMQNLRTEAAAGNSSALVQTSWALLDYSSNNFSYVSPQEAIDKFDKEDTGFLRDKFLPSVLELAISNEGLQVGTPYSLSNPILYINKDILREAGLSEEKSAIQQGVSEFVKAVKEEAGKYGFYIQEPADFRAQQGLIESNEAKMLTINVEDKREATFTTEDGIEAMQLMANMAEGQTALYISWEKGYQSLTGRNCVVFYTTIAGRVSVQKGARSDAATVESPLQNDKEHMVPVGRCSLAITAQNDGQVKVVWEFGKFLCSMESMVTWTEGVGYMSSRKDVVGAESGLKTFLARNKMMNAAIKQMDGVVPWTIFPGDTGLQTERIFLDMRDQILGGQVAVEQGMKATQDTINQLLAVQ